MKKTVEKVMAKVNAKCTNCGEIVFIESKNDANICPYCNAAFVTEKAIKLYKKSPIEGEKTSAKVKRFFKMFGSALLLILQCIWCLICSILLVDFLVDITSNKNKK